MPGATNPIIISGMTKPKKEPKIELKVARILTTGAGVN